jgi:hypothetical protein
LLFLFLLQNPYTNFMTVVDPTASTGSSTAWSSEHAGWHARATPMTEPFEPSRDTLVLASIHSTPVNPEDFTLGLFTPNIAIDSRGALLQVEASDFEALSSLANAAVNPSEVPESGSFRNQWAISHPITSRPIDRLLVPKDADFAEVQVSGFEKGNTQLKRPVDGLTELPGILYEEFGLVLEAREEGPGEPNAALVEKVKALLGEVL